MTTQITKADIVKAAQFQTSTGIIWIIDDVNNGEVRTSMSHGAKGNYLDDLETVVNFLNEENAVKL